MSAPPPPTAPPPLAGATGTDPGAPTPRRLTRQRHGRLVGGVATGLARYLGVDPVVVRLAFVLLAFLPFPGFGLLLYVGMLLLVPEDDGRTDAPTLAVERAPAFWIGVALVGIAALALLGVVAGGSFGALVPLLLIGLGVALWVDADRRPAPTPPTSTPPAWTPPPAATPADPAAPALGATSPGATVPSTTTPGASAPGGPAAPSTATTGAGGAPDDQPPVWGGGGGTDGPPPAAPAPAGPAWTPPPVPSRPRSPLGRVTLGLALLAGGAAWLLDLLEVVTVPLASALAIVLLVLGLGLLVGSVVGRARWLTFVVAALLPVTLVVVVIGELGIDLRGGVDSREVVVTAAEQLDDPLTIGAGELRIDLTRLSDAEGVLVDASVGAGELRLMIPEGIGLTGRVRVEVGELDLLGDRAGGLSIERLVDIPAAPGRPTVELDLRVGAGEISIRSLDLALEEGRTDPFAPGPAEDAPRAGDADDPLVGDADDPLVGDAGESRLDDATEVQP
jgi:phage shock protein PspC (stress-responsive transcriptional regulator)